MAQIHVDIYSDHTIIAVSQKSLPVVIFMVWIGCIIFCEGPDKWTIILMQIILVFAILGELFSDKGKYLNVHNNIPIIPQAQVLVRRFQIPCNYCI